MLRSIHVVSCTSPISHLPSPISKAFPGTQSKLAGRSQTAPAAVAGGGEDDDDDEFVPMIRDPRTSPQVEVPLVRCHLGRAARGGRAAQGGLDPWSALAGRGGWAGRRPGVRVPWHRQPLWIADE